MTDTRGKVYVPVWLVTSGLILMAAGALALSLSIGALTAPTATAAALYDEDRVVAMFEAAEPAVFIVETEGEGQSFGSFGFPFMFPDRGSEFVFPTFGQGSGFLVDTEGHVLTNHHVIDGADTVTIGLSNGEKLEAEVVGYSASHDLALLKVDAAEVRGIRPLPLADSGLVKPGQMAVAIGSPHGLENTVTVGVVSGIERTHGGVYPRPISGMIQTDAAMTSGNSGGPLLNSSGEVIGVNTSIEITSTGASGIGFAVPINIAKDLMPRFLEGKSTAQAWLGIQGGALDASMAELLGIEATEGVYLSRVFPGSPAEAAGLVASSIRRTLDGTEVSVGDVIIAVDGKKVVTVQDMIDHFSVKYPGDTVSLTLLRDGETVVVSATLGEWPEE